MKFGRTYQMTIDGQTQFAWPVAFPTTIEFDINRNTFASANKATFTLYNLPLPMRRDIYFDRFVQNKQLKVVLQAGYVNSPVLPVIFKGDIRVAWSERRGRDWVTQIECFDGGFAFYNSQVSLTVPKGYSMKTVGEKLIATMAQFGVIKGKISDIVLPNNSGLTLVGNTWDILKNLVPGVGQLFVDLYTANILAPDDFVPPLSGIVPTISAATGLLQVPRRTGARTLVTMIFDPQYIVGQLVDLDSLETYLNARNLKVVGIHHYGKISGTQSGDLITELELFSGYPGATLENVGLDVPSSQIA